MAVIINWELSYSYLLLQVSPEMLENKIEHFNADE